MKNYISNKMEYCKLNTVINAIINNRYLKILPLLAIITLFTWDIEIKAQCNTGFTPVEVFMFVNGCEYQIDLCVKCSTGPVPYEAEIMIWGIKQKITEPNCIQSWSFQDVLTYINNHISTFDFIRSYLCINVTAPPCPGQSEVYTFHRPLCMNIELISYFGDDYISYRPCGENFCIESYTYCFDVSTGNFIPTRIGDPTLTGPVNCFTEANEIEVPEEYNQPTECFIYHSPCNP